jgi:hypothetical protein
MSLKVQIEPVNILNNIATSLTAHVINYDLVGVYCQLYWYISDNNGNSLYSGNYVVPQDKLQNWGIDDTLIIGALAEDKGFVIVPNS